MAKAAQSTEGEIELPSGGDAVDTLPVPTSPGQLTADWLTFALNEGGLAGAVVSDIEVSPLDATSGNSGSYAIVKLAYSNRAEGAPDSLFAKMTAESFRGFLGNSHVRESHVFPHLRPATRIRNLLGSFNISSLLSSTLILIVFLNHVLNLNQVDW